MSSTTEAALASWCDTTTTRTILDFVAAAAERDPSLRDRQPYKAAHAGDLSRQD